jgi:hypothetical protein
VVAEACRTDFAADADLMGASSKTISMRNHSQWY